MSSLGSTGLPSLGSPVGSQFHHSPQLTQFFQLPSHFADSQPKGGNTTVYGNPAWQPSRPDLENGGMAQYFVEYVSLSRIEKAHYQSKIDFNEMGMPVCNTVINSSEDEPDYGTTCTQEGAEVYTTDGVKNGFEQNKIADESNHYFHVVNLCLYTFVFSGVQQHCLLSLLEQYLSLWMPNNPISASFPESLAFCTYESQRWRRAYETPSLCQLHTIYRHPCRFGTGGPFFFKLENRIAGLCTMSTTIK